MSFCPPLLHSQLTSTYPLTNRSKSTSKKAASSRDWWRVHCRGRRQWPTWQTTSGVKRIYWSTELTAHVLRKTEVNYTMFLCNSKQVRTQSKIRKKITLTPTLNPPLLQKKIIIYFHNQTTLTSRSRSLYGKEKQAAHKKVVFHMNIPASLWKLLPTQRNMHYIWTEGTKTYSPNIMHALLLGPALGAHTLTGG